MQHVALAQISQHIQGITAAHVDTGGCREAKYLPMHPKPKRVGSSDVKNRTSIGLLGLNLACCKPFTAAMAPTTPKVPSYMPA